MSRFYEGSGSKEEPGGSKIELNMDRQARGHGEKPFSAIVKVNRPNYVPTCVRLRVRLSPELFTAQVTPWALEQLEQDPFVVSISANKLLSVG